MSVNRGQSPKMNSISHDRVGNDSGRNRSVHQFLEKNHHPDNESKNTTMDSISRKKSTPSTTLKSATTAEKTTKIKKNKKSKKKGQVCPEAKKDKEKEKKSQTEFYQDFAPTNDDGYDDDSDSNEYMYEQFSETIEGLVQDNLESKYDQLDKKITAWTKIAQKQDPLVAFRGILRALEEIFALFDKDLSEQMFNRGLDVLALRHCWLQITEEFKNYAITRFPLLKDFIQNFSLSSIDPSLLSDLRERKKQNSLTKIIIEHIEDIENRRIKKKNKKKKKREEKKFEQTLEKNNQPEQLIEDAEGLIEMLSKLKINDEGRMRCYYDKKWLSSLPSRLKQHLSCLADT